MKKSNILFHVVFQLKENLHVKQKDCCNIKLGTILWNKSLSVESVIYLFIYLLTYLFVYLFQTEVTCGPAMLKTYREYKVHLFK